MSNLVHGGVSSKVYGCNLSVAPAVGEPRDALLRVFGKILTSPEFLVETTVIATVPAERGLAPKVYAVFPAGRIEEYIHVSLRMLLIDTFD